MAKAAPGAGTPPKSATKSAKPAHTENQASLASLDDACWGEECQEGQECQEFGVGHDGTLGPEVHRRRISGKTGRRSPEACIERGLDQLECASDGLEQLFDEVGEVKPEWRDRIRAANTT